MKINNMEIEGIIFDIDGTLLNSTGIWAEVDKNFFKKRGMEVPAGYAEAIGHIGLDNAAVYTKTTYHIQESLEEIKAEWKNGVVDFYTNKVTAKPNAIEFLKLLKSHHIPFCAATANDADCYKNGLNHLKIYDLFDFILEVNIFKSKDDPNIYFAASERLGVDPAKCLVFEDLLTAISTASQAGFKTVGVKDESNLKDTDQIKKVSDFYIADYQEIINKITF